ncbi:MAG: hypothetical protein QOD88_4528 [Mycobacterium sp.]|jgi:pimeloyl-ACP methyl ester carboxylesterase|nr:hypothetical protein [Mycobacterium sp.]
MRRDIEFNADRLTLRGWLYLPEGATKPVPTVVMAHGFSCLKEMFLYKYAETFAAAGFGVLVYDNRNFGDSDGMPARKSTRGARSTTTAMPSPTPAAFPRSMLIGSGSGEPATPAGTF